MWGTSFDKIISLGLKYFLSVRLFHGQKLFLKTSTHSFKWHIVTNTCAAGCFFSTFVCRKYTFSYKHHQICAFVFTSCISAVVACVASSICKSTIFFFNLVVVVLILEYQIQCFFVKKHQTCNQWKRWNKVHAFIQQNTNVKFPILYSLLYNSIKSRHIILHHPMLQFVFSLRWFHSCHHSRFTCTSWMPQTDQIVIGVWIIPYIQHGCRYIFLCIFHTTHTNGTLYLSTF